MTNPAFDTIGFLPFIPALEGPWCTLFSMVRKLEQTKYWCAGSTSALHYQIYRRLGFGWSVANFIWKPAHGGIRRQYPSPDAYLGCARSAIEKVSLTFFHVVRREIHERQAQFFIQADAVDVAVEQLSTIVNIYSGDDSDPAAHIAHLFAAGVRATIRSAVESPWQHFKPAYLSPVEEKEDGGGACAEPNEMVVEGASDEGDTPCAE